MEAGKTRGQARVVRMGLVVVSEFRWERDDVGKAVVRGARSRRMLVRVSCILGGWCEVFLLGGCEEVFLGDCHDYERSYD